MKNIFKINLGLFVLFTILYSCNQDNPLGPELAVVNDNFDPVNVFLTADTLFESGTVNPEVKSSWGENASFELIIKGNVSGAVKTYKGTAASFNTTFDGLSSNIYLFKTGEMASVELKLLGYDSIFVCSDTIKIKKPFKFDGESKDGISYFLIDGFDSLAMVPLNSGSPSPDKNDVDVIFNVTSSLSVQESNSLYLSGTDVNNNGWCGDVNHKHLGDLLNKDISDLPIDSGIDPENLYFNAFIYGTGTTNTAVRFKVSEIDNLGDSLNNRFDIYKWLKGTPEQINEEKLTDYSTSDNDSWVFDVVVDWEGWKLVSIPYSKFSAASDPTNGGSGDKIKESFRISGISVSLLSFPLTGESVSTYVDYIMLTTGGKANYN